MSLLTRRGFALGCAAVGLTALAMRLSFLFAWRGTPFFGDLFIDPATYDRWAFQLASGQDWTQGGAYPRAPLYTWLLGLCYGIFGHDLLVPRLVQAAAGALSCVMTVLLGQRFMPRAYALLAGLLAALSWPLVFFDAQLLFPSLVLFLELLFLLALPPAGEGPKARFLLAGALLGLLALANPVALLAAPLFAAALCLRGRAGLIAAGMLTAGCLLALAPVTLRNRLVGGEWVVVSANGGYNFFVGNNADADGLSVWSSEDAILAAGKVPGRPGEASKHYARLAGEWISRHPADFIGLMLRKALYFVNVAEMPSNYPLDHIRDLAPSFPGRLAPLNFGLTGPLALLGCLLAWWAPAGRPVIMLLGTLSMGTVLFFVNTRYRAPLLPLFFLTASLALHRLVESARGDRRAFAGLASLLAVFFLLVNAPIVGPGERRREAPLHEELGKVFARNGRAAEAEAEFLAALRLDAARTGTRYLLASVVLQQGRPGEAEEQFRRVVEDNPRHFQGWNALANIARMRGDHERARELYRKALALEPAYGTARMNLESLDAAEGDP